MAQASGATASTAAGRPATGGLVGKALWSALDFWLQQAAALLVFVVVGNLTGPGTVGVITVAQLGITLAMALLLDGFADALIQRQKLDPAHVDTAFALLFGLGVAAALLLWLLAPGMAALFREPDLAWILPLMALGLPLLGLAVPCQALLQRQMRFRALACRSVVAQGLGFASAVALALEGRGIEALIAYVLLVRVLDALLLTLFARRLPGRTLTREALSDIVGYGKHRVGNQLLGFVVFQIDRITAGLFLGTVTVGLFSLAERIANALTGGLSGVVSRVGFAAFSARQADPSALRRALQDVLFLANLLAMPAFLGLATVSGTLVAALFSREWAPAAPVLAVLALAGIPHATNYVLTAAINARGRPDIALRYSLVIMVLRLLSSLAAAPFGILALAFANLAVTALSTLIVILAVRPHLPGAGVLAARSAGVPVIAGCAMAVAAWGIAEFWSAAPAVLLAAQIIAGAVVYAALVLLLAPGAVRLLRRAT